ncbi:MAG: hypothetical protein PCFJNLEI_03095 [Verrucomicrobiae bacterium]|nr:hypothetical protein [Verrucomicrobiae bacterium]
MPNLDLVDYAGREQAYIKHCLLQEYLPDWGYKIGSSWDTLAYVDGFAGPWKVKRDDCADSSFGVAFEALRKCYMGHRDKWNRKVKFRCIMVEKDSKAFARLEKFTKDNDGRGIELFPINGEFVREIPAIQRILNKDSTNTFKFVLLDPKGWADIPMDEIKPLIMGRSSEVLVNLMTSDIRRFLDEDSRALSFHKLFGRDDVLQKLQELPKGAERTEFAVYEYCRSLKKLCGFKYVSTAVVLAPDKESVKYFLVYATNHPVGIEVFKRAEMKVAGIQEQVRVDVQIRRTGQTLMAFDECAPKSRTTLRLRDRYVALAKDKVLSELLDAGPKGILYSELFCEAMGFGLVQPDDLLGWIKGWEPHVKLAYEKPTSRKPSVERDDRVIVMNRSVLLAERA